MQKKNLLLRIFMTVSLILLTINPASAATVDAYGGYVSDNRVNEGDYVEFSGTFHNFNASTFYLASFNITFVEKLGEGATREPNKPNISRFYPEDRRAVPANESFTETLSREIDFEPGAYNVSIFFEFADSITFTQTTVFQQAYALKNKTFVVEGVTEALRIARYIGLGILITVLGVIGLLIYNAKFKKPY